jgi:hypothetical protein
MLISSDTTKKKVILYPESAILMSKQLHQNEYPSKVHYVHFGNITIKPTLFVQLI